MTKNSLSAYLTIVFLTIYTLSGFAQKSKIEGTISDQRTNETLIGVSVTLDSNVAGTVTNLLGKYSLEVAPGKHTIKFSYLGYTTIIREITAIAGNNQDISLQMVTEQKELKIVTVTGSQYEKDAAREVVSIDVIKKYLVENTNTTDLAKAVEKTPGVVIVDGQASMRGGSGYAYGTGSRVQVVVDDIPLLTGDLSEVRWNFVPIENMEQIEVIKGAASTMFGSGAMNGVIHVRTGYAYDQPQTKISIGQGVYSNPIRKELRWWDNFYNPFFTNAFLSHRQKFGNVDLIVGANLNWNSGYIKYGSDQQARFNFKVRWRPAKLKGFAFELAGNAMYQQFGRFFLWQNPDEGAYIPWSGTNGEEKYTYFQVDPRVTYTGQNGSIHKFRSRFYQVTRWGASDGKQTASSNLFWAEYQYQKQFGWGMNLTAGLASSYTKSFSSLYEGLDLQSLFGATYIQLEKNFKDKLTILAGARYERNKVFGLFDDPAKPVFRVGLNYKAGKASFLRATWGQAYRFPSLGERYLKASISAINIVPNNDLKPEYGWTAEIGFKQGYKADKFMGYLDVSIFWLEFRDMIEYSFLIDLQSAPPLVGFKALNISKARVAGFEVSTIGDGKVLGIPFRLFGGYTFTYPGDLQNDTSQLKANIFLQNLFQSFKGVDSLQNSVLKYRLRNTLRGDIEFDPFKKITIGASVTYNSFMDRIDVFFEDLVDQKITQYRKLNNKGYVVWDARFGYKLSEKSSIFFIIKNIGNKEYSLRPGLMEAPRSFTLNYKLQF